MLTAERTESDELIDDSLAETEVTITHNGESVTTTADNLEAASGVLEGFVKSAVPTADELRAAHYREIVAESLKVEQARVDYEESAAETKRLKKEYEGSQALFLRLTRRDPLQRTLLPTPDPNLADGGSNPLPGNDEWRGLSVDVLGLKDSATDKLINGKLETLGDLQDFWKSGKRLRDEIDGIGETLDATIVDAFSDYGAENPEVFGQAPAGDAEGDEEADNE